MPLLKTEASKLSSDLLLSGVIEELIEKDEMFALFPFMRVENKSVTYIRENQAGMEAAISGNTHVDWLDPNDTIPEAAVGFDEVTVTLRILAGQVDVDLFLQNTMADTNSQLATQLAAKAKIIRSVFQRNFAIGNASTNPKQFDGIHRLVSNDQTITAGANGASLSFDMLDELQDSIPYGADALIMHSKTKRAIKAMMRALNITPEYIEMSDVGIRPFALNGLPVIINDYLPTNEEVGASGTVCTSIYAARFNEADGLHGLYGGPTVLQYENLGLVADKDATRHRVKTYMGTALKSTKSLSRLRGIKLS
jgi:HK97 family phage major capsid protein